MINTLTTRQICHIIVLKPQKEIELPTTLPKKKSRSIDSRKIEHHHYKNHTSQSIETKTWRKPPSKKSVDWGLDVLEEHQKQLEPIAEEQVIKKVK